MQISHRQITFGWNENKKQLYLSNNTQKMLIFKIKTTQLNLLAATPNREYLQKNESKVIQITCKQLRCKFQAKLSIVSGEIKQKYDTFEKSWAKINQNEMQTNIILLARAQELQIINQEQFESSNDKLQGKIQDIYSEKSISMNSNSMNSNSIKSNQCSVKSIKDTTQFDLKHKNSLKESFIMQQTKYGQEKLLRSVTSPLRVSRDIPTKNFEKKQTKMMMETKPIRQQKSQAYRHIKQEQSLQNRMQSESQLHLNQSFNYFQNSQAVTSSRQSVLPEHFQSMNPNHLAHMCFIQSQLLSQRQQNKRLAEQLHKNKQLDKTREQMRRHYQIKRSMTEQCDHDLFDWPIAILMAVVFFTIGLLVSMA